MQERTGSDQRGRQKKREEKEMAEQQGRCGNVRRDLEMEGGREREKEEGKGRGSRRPIAKAPLNIASSPEGCDIFL